MSSHRVVDKIRGGDFVLVISHPQCGICHELYKLLMASVWKEKFDMIDTGYDEFEFLLDYTDSLPVSIIFKERVIVGSFTSSPDSVYKLERALETIVNTGRKTTKKTETLVAMIEQWLENKEKLIL